MGTKEAVYKELGNKGEDVTVYNSIQTTDSDTAYESVVTDDFVDGTNTGTSEKAVVFPMKQSKDQAAEGQLPEGDMEAFFRYDSIITADSLVKINRNNYLYKVKKIDQLVLSGELVHYEVLLEFVRDTTE